VQYVFLAYFFNYFSCITVAYFVMESLRVCFVAGLCVGRALKYCAVFRFVKITDSTSIYFVSIFDF